jgi:hypothetical protein
MDAREGSVKFIKEHFTIALAQCPDEEPAMILAAEALVLAALRPRFNKKSSGRRKGVGRSEVDSREKPSPNERMQLTGPASRLSGVGRQSGRRKKKGRKRGQVRL